jgi:phytoene desaturase
VYKPGQSLLEFADWEVVKNVFRLDVFTSIKKHVAKHFKKGHAAAGYGVPGAFPRAPCRKTRRPCTA